MRQSAAQGGRCRRRGARCDSHQCPAGRRHRSMGHNANGAGIAADPTLTSAWIPLAHDTSGEPSASLAPGHTWRPMSGPGTLASCNAVRRDCSPALAPASGFRFCPLASFEARSPRIAAASRSRLAETVFPFRSGLAADRGLRPSPAPVPTRFPACPVASRRSCFNKRTCHRPKPSACPLSAGAWTITTAISGLETSGTSVPCGTSFRRLRVPKTS